MAGTPESEGSLFIIRWLLPATRRKTELHIEIGGVGEKCKTRAPPITIRDNQLCAKGKRKEEDNL